DRPLAGIRAPLDRLAASRDGRGWLPRVGHVGRIHGLGPARSLRLRPSRGLFGRARLLQLEVLPRPDFRSLRTVLCPSIPSDASGMMADPYTTSSGRPPR